MQQRISTIEEYQKQINILVEYINNHLSEPIDLVKLAEVCHFSPYHFHRITRAFLGEPIGGYIVRMRLETAAKLIRYTDLPVSEIAYKVGYDVPTSLSKAFKQQYGISPIEYRADKDYFIMNAEKKDIQLKIKAPKIMDIPSNRRFTSACRMNIQTSILAVHGNGSGNSSKSTNCLPPEWSRLPFTTMIRK